MTHVRTVQPGQRLHIPASEWNTIAGVVNRHAGQGDRPNIPRFDPTRTTVRVKNETGATVPARAVLGIDGTVFDELIEDHLEVFTDNLIFSGVTPAFPAHFNRFVVTTEPIENGQIGRALLSGITAIQIDIPTGATAPRFAEVRHGSTTRLNGRTGGGSANVLWVESGTGADKWAVVQLGAGRPVLMARVQSSSSLGGNKWSYTCAEAVHGAAGAWTVVSGGASVSARNRMEAPNSGSGVQGNGVNLSNLTGTFSVRPVATGTIVELVGPYGAAGSEWWEMETPNAVDGQCP